MNEWRLVRSEHRDGQPKPLRPGYWLVESRSEGGNWIIRASSRVFEEAAETLADLLGQEVDVTT